MRNMVREGNLVPFTAPAAVVAGQGVLVGLMFGVSTTDVANGAIGEMVVEGIVTLPKVTGTAINEGVRVFWDNSAGNVTTTATSNNCIGWAVGPGNYATGATTINVKLGGPNATAA